MKRIATLRLFAEYETRSHLHNGPLLLCVIILLSRAWNVLSNEQLSEEYYDEVDCPPGKYFDGVIGSCIACSYVCQPILQSPDFCRNNCPEYYKEHFVTTRSPLPTTSPSPRENLPTTNSNNINSTPASAAAAVATRFPRVHNNPGASPVNTTAATQHQRDSFQQHLPLIRPSLPAADHLSSTTTVTVATTTSPLPDISSDGGENSSFIGLAVVSFLLLCAIVCLIFIVCRTRRHSGRKQSTLFCDVEDGVERSPWLLGGSDKNSSSSRPSSITSSATSGLPSTSSRNVASSDFDNGSPAGHENVVLGHQSSLESESLTTSSSVTQQEDDRRSVLTTAYYELPRGTDPTSSSISLVCVLQPAHGLTSTVDGDCNHANLLQITCSLCPSTTVPLGQSVVASING